MVGGAAPPRVGVPRSILHYEFNGAIARFLRALGVEVVLSPPTNAEIFRTGKRLVIDELCFPIKIFVGHVAHLASQGVDRIVIPTIVGHVSDRVFPCHPRSRLPDIVRALAVCEADRLLTPAFRYDREGLAKGGFLALAQSLGISEVAAERALPERRPTRQTPNVPAAPDGLTIGVVGHPYVVEDRWASNQLVGRLERLNCRVVTDTAPTPIDYAPEGTGLHFALAARTVRMTRAFDCDDRINGIAFLLPFNCGPDGDVARHLARTTSKPLLTLVLDELQSSAGLVTRLEAFIDLLRPVPAAAGGRST